MKLVLNLEINWLNLSMEPEPGLMPQDLTVSFEQSLTMKWFLATQVWMLDFASEQLFWSSYWYDYTRFIIGFTPFHLLGVSHK